MKKTISLILVLLCVVCTSAIYAAVDFSAADTDYGLEIFGKAVTSSYKSNTSEGWSFNPTTNTLTLTDGDKFTAAFEKMTNTSDSSLCAFARYDRSIGAAAFAYYMAAVEVKTLTNLNVEVTGDVTIGKSSWSTWYNVKDASGLTNVRTHGFYSRTGGITVTGGGKLTVYSTDTVFYTNGDFKTDGKVQLDLTTWRTAAIYAQGKIIIDNGSKVKATTKYLGGIYKSYYSKLYYDGDKENDSKGTIQYDSMAAVISTRGDHPNGISVLNESTLDVYSCVGDPVETKLKLTQNREHMPDADHLSDGTRAFYAIWADRSDINIESNSKLNVKFKAENGVYERLHPAVIGWKCLYRTIAVNSSIVTVKNSDIVIDADNPDVTFVHDYETYTGKELGDYADFFYNQSYYFPETNLKDNSIRGSMFYMYGASSVQLIMGDSYGEDNLCHLLDYKGGLFEFHDTYEGKKYYYCMYPEAAYNGGLYIYIKSYEKGPTYYLRENGGKYEYSEYFDFRSDIQQISSNTLDIDALGWSDKTLHIKSGNYTIKLPVNNNLKIFDGSESSTVTIKLEGGKTYNGSYDVTVAGKLIVEGDGIIKELWTHGTMECTWDGNPGVCLLSQPEFHVYSGTIAGGSSGGLRISVQGGNVAYNEDMQATYYANGSRTLKRVTIDLGEFADIFTSDMLRISREYSYNTTGIYPVDGKIYFWELEKKIWNVGDHPSQMAFNHLEITEDYTYYVYPKQVTDSQGNVIKRQYTLYRLPERIEVMTVDNDVFFATGTDEYATNVELNSFYYARVVDRPAYSDPLYTDETTTTVLSVYHTPQNGDYVEWTCKDKDGKQINLGRVYDSLSLTAEKLHYQYHDYQCVLYSIDGTVKKTHNFDLHILVYYNTESKHAERGETVTFEAQYYTDGTWLEDYGFQWCWQWRAGSNASWNTVDDTDAFYDYTAFWESYENSAHCYGFRRVAYLNRINEESVFLPSPTMLLTMCSYITSAPEKVEIQSNDPAESIDIKVEATRAHWVYWGKMDMDGNNWVEIEGANSLTLSLPRSEYTKEDGSWDPAKVDGIYTCSVYDMGYGSTASVQIKVEVIEPLYFTSELPDKLAATGGLIYYNVSVGGPLKRVDNIWWEYSLDDGSTWIKMNARDSSEYYRVNYEYTFVWVDTGLFGYVGGSKLEFNTADIDAEKVLIRSGMRDNRSVTYYSNVSTLTFVDLPVIARQPQSQAVNLKLGTASMDFAFEEPIPSEYAVTYQWQVLRDYIDESNNYWENINSGNFYTCNGQSIEFNLNNIARTNVLTHTYRCKISFTNVHGVTVDVYTVPATLEIVKDHTHSWATEWTTDGTYHWHECTAKGCDVIENAGKQGYGAHSCTDDSTGKADYFNKAVCDVCHEAYGEPLADSVAPTGTVTVGTGVWDGLCDIVSFDRFFKEAQGVTITARDDSYDHTGYTEDKAVRIAYYLYSGDTALTAEDLADIEFTAYNGAFSIDSDNRYVLYVRLTDHAGNVTYLSSEGFVVDTTPPVLSGVENGKTYSKGKAVTVTEANLKSVTVNGEEVTLDENNQLILKPQKGMQTIVVTDWAGNVTAEMTVRITAYEKGDMDNNGRIEAIDALIVLKTLVGKHAANDDEKQAADVNEDGKISAVDALEILKKAVGKEACF